MRLIPLLTAFMIWSSSACGQNLLSFHDTSGIPIPNGALLMVNGDATDMYLQAQFGCHLNGTDAKLVGLKRYELTTLLGTANYMCNLWMCSLPSPAGTQPLLIAFDDQNLQPGVIVPGMNFYHSPENTVGCMDYRFVWYDVNDPIDSSWVDIRFCGLAVGVDEVGTGPSSSMFKLWPNPNAGEILYLEIPELGIDEVHILNASGSLVANYGHASNSRSFPIDLSGLPSGLYTCAVLREGVLVGQKRLAINR